MEIFSTRELALGLWLCAFIVFFLARKSLRGPIPGLLRYAFAKRLRPIYAATFIYIILIVAALSALGFWNSSHLKSTIIWAISVAFVSLFRLPDKAKDFTYFKQVVADNLKLIVVFEFVISSYTFALWIELLILPLATFIMFMVESSQNEPKFKAAHTLFTNLMAFLGIVILVFAFYQLFEDFESFATMQTLSEFSLPPILTFLFLPFLYGLAVYAIYETVFSVMDIFIPDEAVRRHARFKSLVTFRNDVRLFQRWHRDIVAEKPRTVEAVDQSIKAVLRRRAKEQHPKDIAFEQGWSPYSAKEFLADNELTSDEYHRILPKLDDWCASSNHLNLSAGPLPSHICYYVDGDEDAAKQLKLVMNINEPERNTAASEVLAELADALCQKALSVELPLTLRNAILGSSNASQTIKGKPITVTHEVFTGSIDGFTTRFQIGDYQPTYQTASA